jgi:hypothetical protein
VEEVDMYDENEIDPPQKKSKFLDTEAREVPTEEEILQRRLKKEREQSNDIIFIFICIFIFIFIFLFLFLFICFVLI